MCLLGAAVCSTPNVTVCVQGCVSGSKSDETLVTVVIILAAIFFFAVIVCGLNCSSILFRWRQHYKSCPSCCVPGFLNIDGDNAELTKLNKEFSKKEEAKRKNRHHSRQPACAENDGQPVFAIPDLETPEDMESYASSTEWEIEMTNLNNPLAPR